MKRLILFLLSLVVAGPLGATAQAPDLLTIDGKTYPIHTNPLAPVLAANPGRLPEPGVISSGLWRGYIATWSVRENRLFLDDVSVPTREYMDDDAPESKRFLSAMKPLFGEAGPRVATWFTGYLIVPTGKIVQYVHMGYASTYQSYMILKVIDGAIHDRRELTLEEFKQFRRSQYEAFKKTPEYAKARAEAQQGEPMTDESVEDFLFQFTSEEYLSRIFEPAKP